LDQADDALQLLARHLEPAHQAVEVAVSEQLQMVLDQPAGRGQPRRVLGQSFQLQQQALRRPAGAHALRIEVLHPFQHRLGLGQGHGELALQSLTNLFQRQSQITGFVDRVDDGGGDREFPTRLNGVSRICQYR
jgi:hypothetical protein